MYGAARRPGSARLHGNIDGLSVDVDVIGTGPGPAKLAGGAATACVSSSRSSAPLRGPRSDEPTTGETGLRLNRSSGSFLELTSTFFRCRSQDI